MRGLLKGLIGIGVLILIGTAGASDANSISFSQIVLQILVSFAFIALGCFGLNFIKLKQKCIKKTKCIGKSKFSQAA